MIAARTSASRAELLDWLPESVTATAPAHTAMPAAEIAERTATFWERRLGGRLPVLDLDDSSMIGEPETATLFGKEPVFAPDRSFP